MERKTTRQLQAENTKKLLLKVIEDMLKEYTYDQMSIQEICRRAGVSVGTYYHYFESKASIVIELYRDCDDYFQNVVIKECLELEEVDAIVHFGIAQAKYAFDRNVDLIKNIYKAQVDHGSEFFLSVTRGLPVGMRQLVDRAVDNGVFKSDTDRALLTSDLLLIVRGHLYNWCISDGKSDLLGGVERMMRIYLKDFIK